jgi:anhydro-N-acetylmuramic acid kinase
LKRNTQKEKPRLAVGLMAGTSMDGIDAALVSISRPPEKPRVKLLAFLTQPYRTSEREAITHVAAGGPASASAISQLNFLLGELFADATLAVCRRGRVSPKRLTVVGSHGQTIYHQGTRSREAGREIASTLQIAEPAVIAERTGARVVADFRTADMAAGGQGAPLVPMVDYLLLRHQREGRVALNIGGIANVTVIPAGAKPEDVFGFDTGPGNMVIDALVRHFTRGRKSYDAGGRVARQGNIDEVILAAALADPFFQRQPPKSAGREQFGQGFLKKHFLTRRRVRFEDAVRTATELTARTVAQALECFVFPRVKVRRLIVSGGGAHNKHLMRRLGELLPQLEIELSDRYGLPVDAKEAIAFAVLADRTMHGLPGNLPSVTGADRAVILGKLVLPG